MASPKVFLFDIGGVCAIVDYERAHNIPQNWVNFAISRSSKSGAWQRAERGESALENDWFEDFRRDLHNPKVWEEFHRVYVNKGRSGGARGSEIPPMPTMDSTTLFWMMMIVSREEDPHMAPALRKLKESGRYIIGALSNTYTFPAWHPFANVDVNSDIRGLFDVFVSSSHVGLRKPSREIYEYAVKKLDEFDREKGGSGIKPENIVFLDDIGENLKGAKAVGMGTIKVWLGKTEDAVKVLEKTTGLELSEKNKSRL